MGDLAAPVGCRVDVGEVVLVAGRTTGAVAKGTGLDGGGGVYRIDAGLVQGYRIEAGKDADVGDYGGIVFIVAVAVR